MVKAGAIIDARFFKSVVGISSGPLALWTSKLESKVVIPSMVILIFLLEYLIFNK